MLYHEALVFFKKKMEVKLYLVLEVNAMAFFCKLMQCHIKHGLEKRAMSRVSII
jgi:hypothetical protein